MATKQEKQELIDAIKRPYRYYRITLWGYGGEAAYLKLTKEQYEFWKAKDDENYDTTMTYMNEAEDQGKPEWVPDEMDFMAYKNGNDEVYYNGWHDSPTEFCHQWGVTLDGNITIDEIESEEYGADVLGSVIEKEEIQSYLNNLDEENNYELEPFVWGEATDEYPDYVLQFYSAEKGTFFEGIFVSNGPFDPKKLKVYVDEYPNGEEVVIKLTYADEEIENMGGDTNGKGYSVHMWSNV